MPVLQKNSRIYREIIIITNLSLTHSSSVVNSSLSTLPAPTLAPSSTWSVHNSESPVAAAPPQPPTTSPVCTLDPTPGSNSTSTPAPPHTPSRGPVPSPAAAEEAPHSSPLYQHQHQHQRQHQHQIQHQHRHHPVVEPLLSGASVVVSVLLVLLVVLVDPLASRLTTTTVSFQVRVEKSSRLILTKSQYSPMPISDHDLGLGTEA